MMVKISDQDWKKIEYFADKFQWACIWQKNKEEPGNETDSIIERRGEVKPWIRKKDLGQIDGIFDRIDHNRMLKYAKTGRSIVGRPERVAHPNDEHIVRRLESTRNRGIVNWLDKLSDRLHRSINRKDRNNLNQNLIGELNWVASQLDGIKAYYNFDVHEFRIDTIIVDCLNRHGVDTRNGYVEALKQAIYRDAQNDRFEHIPFMSNKMQYLCNYNDHNWHYWIRRHGDIQKLATSDVLSVVNDIERKVLDRIK